MIFHSLQFLFFFAVVYSLYLSFPHRAQNRFLLVASYVFYASWDWRFLSLILITTTADFLIARAISNTSVKSQRKIYVAISCAINLGILGTFKYFNFFVDNFLLLFSYFGIDVSGPTIEILLPVGISFYTFQSMSYTLDVYRKQIKPTESFYNYALYVAFFPQLVAGPIERSVNLLPQITTPRVFSTEKFQQGIVLIMLGIFKKLYIADNLGGIVNPIFASGADPTGTMILIGGYAFLFQVYCDFSAYTDIARGISKLMGFELMENFRAPYFAKNIQDFWNRWHISLTTWIRDYLYYTIAFKRFRKKSIPPSLVTIFTFTIMGLWHGAAWGYVLWGIYNGIVLAAYGKISPYLARKSKLLKTNFSRKLAFTLSVFLTFHFVLIGDLFFRSSSLEQSSYMVWTLFTSFSPDLLFIDSLMEITAYILPILLIDWFSINKPFEYRFFELPCWMRYLIVYLMFSLVSQFGASTPGFIYFQF